MNNEFQLPGTYQQAMPILQRLLQENSATLLKISGAKKRPLPPRNLIAQGGSLELLITWNAPQIRSSDIAGWRVYRDNETNLVQNITDPSARQTRVKVPANTSVALYVSSVSTRGAESSKVQIIGKANTDQYVVAGTAGGTGGSAAPPPPGYPSEPTGGGSGRIILL